MMLKEKRLRLAPKERRNQLLDSARDIILSRGFSSLTMEAVTKEADVSNPLIYKYFDTRLALLQELLGRELLRFYGDIKLKLEKAKTYEDVVRIAVTSNFDEGANGNIVSILRSQPDIEASLHPANMKDTLGVGELLVDRLMEFYPVSRSQAAKMTIFASGVSQAAAAQWRLHGGNRKRMIADALQFIHSGMKSFVSPD
ncbi:MAG: TetR/AcrR family transcriptional regulator [Parasphingorhabdus sp.]|uniref:TetR/AcrR family transcriptional regulator n=1 Tax=Parasphingorhabdus sp. TaxID=2709688 RepID=UPI0032972B91